MVFENDDGAIRNTLVMSPSFLEAAECYQLNQLCVLRASAFPFLLFKFSSSSDLSNELNYQHLCTVLSRRKTLIGQKDRTQKNESFIFLRSIFLPYNWYCYKWAERIAARLRRWIAPPGKWVALFVHITHQSSNLFIPQQPLLLQWRLLIGTGLFVHGEPSGASPGFEQSVPPTNGTVTP